MLLPLDAKATGRSRRLATLEAGLTFGEMMLLDEAARSADVVCDEPSTIASLSSGALKELDLSYPAIRQSVGANLARLLARRLRAESHHVANIAGQMRHHATACNYCDLTTHQMS